MCLSHTEFWCNKQQTHYMFITVPGAFDYGWQAPNTKFTSQQLLEAAGEKL
jgi:hypothetical protein